MKAPVACKVRLLLIGVFCECIVKFVAENAGIDGEFAGIGTDEGMVRVGIDILVESEKLIKELSIGCLFADGFPDVLHDPGHDVGCERAFCRVITLD